jgi:hypothetical protein
MSRKRFPMKVRLKEQFKKFYSHLEPRSLVRASMMMSALAAFGALVRFFHEVKGSQSKTEAGISILSNSGTPAIIQRPMRTSSLSQFVKLHRQLTEERGTLESRLREIDEALGERPLPSLSLVQGTTDQAETELTRPGRRGKRRMSPEGRARIAAAQRARWAKRNEGKGSASAAASAPKPKRRMSAAGRKAIAEGARKRWAAAKAAGRTKL